MLKKIVSTASREKREGEIEGWDYYFMSFEDIENLKKQNKLMQHISFDGMAYAYENKEFDNLDELIVICGGSGAGKDKTFLYLYEEKDAMWNEKETGYLFSIPKTLELFVNHGKDRNITVYPIFLYVQEIERFRRVLDGTINADEKLVNKYDLKNKSFDYDINKYNLDTIVSLDSEIIEDSDIEKIIENTKKRILRDRKDPFENQINNLVQNGLDIKVFDTTKDTLEMVMEKIKNYIKEQR